MYFLVKREYQGVYVRQMSTFWHLVINSGKRNSNAFIESLYLFSFVIHHYFKWPLLNNSHAFEEDWGEIPVTSFKKPFFKAGDGYRNFNITFIHFPERHEHFVALTQNGPNVASCVFLKWRHRYLFLNGAEIFKSGHLNWWINRKRKKISRFYKRI